MDSLTYVGLAVRKETITYCVKQICGTRIQQGSVRATRGALDAWGQQLPGPGVGALEATLFTE